MCEPPSKAATMEQQLISENELNVYPNPVSGSAHIDYLVSEPGLVRIVVYNSLGQQVSVLVNKYHEEGGYIAEWNGSTYPEGLYVCRMYTGFRVISKTMILKK